MRLTRRIALPTGLEISFSARPLPPDAAKATPTEPESESTESPLTEPRAETSSPRIG